MTTAKPQHFFSGPAAARLTIALAHGAGAPMDTPFMEFFAEGLAKAGYRVARFEFPYMAARRENGKRKPPDRQPILLDTWRAVIAELGANNLVIGGKSMGGRMASLIADESKVRGLICLGYPFYGRTFPGKVGTGLPSGNAQLLKSDNKAKPRTEHLKSLKTPTLICQGTRDPMGNREDVEKLPLSRAIRLHWAEDGDHDLKPRKASGLSHDDHMNAALDAATTFLSALS